MALPKLNSYPVNELTLPSSGQIIKFRPFLVKEEKILLTGFQSEDIKDQLNSIEQVVTNCILTEGVDVSSFTMLDMEYFFLKLRAKSVGEIVNLKFRCKRPLENGEECGHLNLVEVDLDTVEPEKTEELDPNILLDEKQGIGVIMRKPKFDIFYKMRAMKDQASVDLAFGLLGHCIQSVYDAEQTYNEFTEAEMNDFLESLSRDQMSKINDYLDKLPSLKKEIEIKCEGRCGIEEPLKYTIEGYENFLA